MTVGTVFAIQATDWIAVFVFVDTTGCPFDVVEVDEFVSFIFFTFQERKLWIVRRSEKRNKHVTDFLIILGVEVFIVWQRRLLLFQDLDFVEPKGWRRSLFTASE